MHLLCPTTWSIITHAFSHHFQNFINIGFGIVLFPNNVTFWGDDLHAPSFRCCVVINTVI
jgi:hypothetical protein